MLRSPSVPALGALFGTFEAQGFCSPKPTLLLCFHAMMEEEECKAILHRGFCSQPSSQKPVEMQVCGEGRPPVQSIILTSFSAQAPLQGARAALSNPECLYLAEMLTLPCDCGENLLRA